MVQCQTGARVRRTAGAVGRVDHRAITAPIHLRAEAVGPVPARDGLPSGPACVRWPDALTHGVCMGHPRAAGSTSVSTAAMAGRETCGRQPPSMDKHASRTPARHTPPVGNPGERRGGLRWVVRGNVGPQTGPSLKCDDSPISRGRVAGGVQTSARRTRPVARVNSSHRFDTRPTTVC